MKTKHILASLLLVLATGLVSCSSGPESGAAEAEMPLASDAADNYEVTASQFTSSNMQLGKIQPQEFHRTVRATGMIDVPPENKATLSAYFGGFVKQISILPGVAVRKGETLFVLENPEYVQVQQEFLEAKGQLEYLRSDYERQKLLASENVSSQKQYLKAESDYTVTRVRYESLKKKLALMNIDADKLTEDKLRSQIAVTAPISGFVTEVNVNLGAYLNPSDIALTITNTEHLHLELNIFEKDLAQVKEGQTILFNLQNDGDRKYEAHVHLINKTVDPEKRTISIHGHLNDEKNPHPFTTGMYLEAQILTDSEKLPALPEEAVVEMEDKHFVLVKQGGNEGGMSFVKREVEIGQTGAGFVELRNAADFEAGTEFLVKGAFALITD